jgi:hypothetical protein
MVSGVIETLRGLPIFRRFAPPLPFPILHPCCFFARGVAVKPQTALFAKKYKYSKSL